MKPTTIIMRMIICFLSVAGLAGCMSVGTTPAPRFYMLSSLALQPAPESQALKGAIVEIGPVKVPNYQDRPQIVTQDAQKMLTISQFDRWGESLDAGLARVITEDLTRILPESSLMMFPSNYAIPVNYRVMIEVLQLESTLDADLLLVAQWSVIDQKNNLMLVTRRSEFRRQVRPNNYQGLAATLSSGCLSLSSEIADTLIGLAKAAGGP